MGELSLDHLLRITVVERHGSGEHDVQNDSGAPDVDSVSRILSASKNLGSHVGTRSTEGPRLFTGLQDTREPEIAEFDVLVLVQENVLALEVSMDDAVVLEVLKE